MQRFTSASLSSLSEAPPFCSRRFGLVVDASRGSIDLMHVVCTMPRAASCLRVGLFHSPSDRACASLPWRAGRVSQAIFSRVAFSRSFSFPVVKRSLANSDVPMEGAVVYGTAWPCALHMAMRDPLRPPAGGHCSFEHAARHGRAGDARWCVCWWCARSRHGRSTDIRAAFIVPEKVVRQ